MTLNDALLGSLKYCAPFDFLNPSKLRFSEPLIGLLVSYISFVLLSLAALGITSRIIRSK